MMEAKVETNESKEIETVAITNPFGTLMDFSQNRIDVYGSISAEEHLAKFRDHCAL
jgi:hypothetical protein